MPLSRSDPLRHPRCTVGMHHVKPRRSCALVGPPNKSRMFQCRSAKQPASLMRAASRPALPWLFLSHPNNTTAPTKHKGLSKHTSSIFPDSISLQSCAEIELLVQPFGPCLCMYVSVYIYIYSICICIQIYIYTHCVEVCLCDWLTGS